MEIAIIGLLAVIIGQFVYMIYVDKLNREERDKLHLKIMSRDVTEYKEATSPPDKDTPEQRDAYLPLEDISIETLSDALDNTETL